MSHENATRVGYVFAFLGAIGFVITLVVNCLGILLFDTPAASFFANTWWTQWSTLYLVWLSFFVIGSALSMSARRAGLKR